MDTSFSPDVFVFPFKEASAQNFTPSYCGFKHSRTLHRVLTVASAFEKTSQSISPLAKQTQDINMAEQKSLIVTSLCPQPLSHLPSVPTYERFSSVSSPAANCEEDPALPEWSLSVFGRVRARLVVNRLSLQSMRAWGRAAHLEWVRNGHLGRAPPPRLHPIKLPPVPFPEPSRKSHQNIPLKTG